ncbi:hypothetical protein [uncultured Megasphaera sp.]|uniref:hypothetical protein n=1 Tax=uncultured Megasphaera sp. TaxID=165188 RepID=UPI00258B9D52|nr:hypothetical protein [uncultured Megasphaera sp.]
MAGIDISKLKDAQFDDEEPKKTSSDMPLPAVPVSSPAPITHRQSQGNVLARADSLGLAANVGQYGLSVAKKSFKPMMIASIATNVLDLCQTIAQVHQNIRAEEEATKRYKIQADAFMGTQKEITARMHDAEETKRMQISKDYEHKLLSITKEMEAMKLAYQDKDKERGFRRDNLERDYQSLSQALDYFLTKCQSCQDEYIKSHCKNEKLLEQLDEAEQKIMTIITLITHLDYSKGE